jgi:hypothetical protein
METPTQVEQEPASSKQPATTRLTREELYELVWSEAMRTLAPKVGMSDVGLAKVCKRMRIPLPGRGYWAQFEVGKGPPRAPLHEAQPGDVIEWARDGGSPRRVPRALPQAPEKEEAKEPSCRSVVRDAGRSELLAGARDHFAKTTQVYGELYPRPTKRRLVDIYVSPEALDRALKVANSVFRALEQAGHRVGLASVGQALHRPAVDERSAGGRERQDHSQWRPDRPTVVHVGTVAIGLTLFELSEVVEVQYVDHKWTPARDVPIWKRLRATTGFGTSQQDWPSGKLCLRASSPYDGAKWEKQWREARKGELISLRSEIVAELARAAPIVAKLVEEHARQVEILRKEAEERWRECERQEAERRRLKHIKESREQLFAIVEDWGIAQRIEGFFADAERRASDLPAGEREAVFDRVHGARALLGGTDALGRFEAWKGPEERATRDDLVPTKTVRIRC